MLSKVPTPLHSIHAVDQARRKELEGHLAYLEGCYGGLPTLQATNLWKSLSTPEEVNRLVSLWILTLHKNVRFQYKVCNRFVHQLLPEIDSGSG